MVMKLEELNIDDEDLLQEDPVEGEFNEDSYTKNWMNPHDNSDPNPDDVEGHREQEEDEDLVISLLKSKGINPESIKFQTEQGEIEEKKFEDLSKEEQLEILSYDYSNDNYGLDDDEVSLISLLRDNNLSVEDYNRYIGNKAIQAYLENQDSDTHYEVDDISDDELFITDLKTRIPEISEEDANSELELAKQNEALYQKKIQSIRNEYKQKEELLLAQEQQEKDKQAAEEAQQFEDSIVQAIEESDSIDIGDSSIVLSEDDMNEIASFILDSDATGVRHLAKALNDPKTLVGMVWYALKGKEAFNQISSYYKQKITEAAKFNYNKGYEDAKTGVKRNTSKSVVKKSNGQNNNKQVLTINDLDVE